MNEKTTPKVTYADSGVHIDALDAVKRRIGKAVASTHGPRVLSKHGAFGGLFDIAGLDEKDPILVGSVDGVGTKVKVAQMMGAFGGLGLDIVNHCIDDLLVGGARPLFFMDYLASSQMKNDVAEAVVTSIAAACKQAGIALLAGETAEMPGVYCEGEFDVVGSIVGVVDRSRILDGSAVRPGDVLLGLPSTGLHTNGYSLARRVLVDAAGRSLEDTVPGTEESVGDALIKPHCSYLPQVSACFERGLDIHGLSHITGGGYEGNISRVMPKGRCAVVDARSWEPLPIFQLIQAAGPVESKEMYRVFNMGMGFVVVLPAEQVEAGLEAMAEAVKIGYVKDYGEKASGVEIHGI